MKSLMGLLLRVCFLIVVLALLIMGVSLAWFTSWRSDKVAELDSGSEIVTTNLGNVEFTVQGEGPSVLVFHGAPGGYDQSLLLGTTLAGEGFQVIAPSRPGYLRTPLGSGLLPEQQADVMAALLDTLGTQTVAVLASSAGAPAAVQFALRHPNRLSALVLVSPVTKRFDVHAANILGAEPGKLVLQGLTGDVGSWYALELADKNPRKSLTGTFEMENTGSNLEIGTLVHFVANNTDQLEWYQRLLGTFAPISPRETGTRNDILQIRNLPPLSFDKIAVPTLIVQGTMDKITPYADAKEVSTRIPSAKFFPVEGAGHLALLGPGAAEVTQTISQFLQLNTTAAPQTE